MKTVFIGGSRHISRLPSEVKARLDSVIDKQHRVLIGDANGADKAVQKHFADASYQNVTVYCTGEEYRNNLGHWPVHNVVPPKGAKGFSFYAAKDREMAREADIGLMIWDGKSPGTLLNVLRLVKNGKISVLYNAPEKRSINIDLPQWDKFLGRCDASLIRDLQSRATPDELEFVDKHDQEPTSGLKDSSEKQSSNPIAISDVQLTEALNVALATSEFATFIEVLGEYARKRGMTEIAKETGLARESLYRALSSGGNPEFSTILRVISAIGLRLEACSMSPMPDGKRSTAKRVREHKNVQGSLY
ncbi:MAG TPA: addiction module antidote protein [Terriglobia bacterium]|nr:addiction module antidote protein [Terriglobia bacterium]